MDRGADGTADQSKADAVIAVSASGFTTTARGKPNAHGIHLRDFATLSREEIRNWGRTRTITLNFCEFTNVRSPRQRTANRKPATAH